MSEGVATNTLGSQRFSHSWTLSSIYMCKGWHLCVAGNTLKSFSFAVNVVYLQHKKWQALSLDVLHRGHPRLLRTPHTVLARTIKPKSWKRSRATDVPTAFETMHHAQNMFVRSKRTATTLRWMRYRRRLRICHRRWKGCGKSSKSRLRLPSTPRSRSSSGHSLCVVG